MRSHTPFVGINLQLKFQSLQQVGNRHCTVTDSLIHTPKDLKEQYWEKQLVVRNLHITADKPVSWIFFTACQRLYYGTVLLLDPNFFHPVSRIPDPGSKRFRIPDPDQHQRIYVFYSKKFFLSSRKYDPGCSSRILILIFYPSRRAGKGCQREWKQLRLESPSREDSEWNQSDNLVLVTQAVKKKKDRT